MAWTPPRDPAGFYTNEGPSGKAVFIESDRIDECIEYARASGVSRLAIAYYTGYRNNELKFLERCDFASELSIQDGDKYDIEGISSLKDRLERLWLSGSAQPLDLTRFPKLREYRGDWHPKLRITEECVSLRSLALWKFKPRSRDLSEQLPSLPQLESLELIQSPLLNLRGVGRFPNLKKLEAAYLTKLESIEGIEELSAAPLEWFTCEKCKKIRDHERAAAVAALRVLRFIYCGVIQSLCFLKELPNLEDFRFGGTDVTDGDMSPLLRLKSVWFTRKKHFSHTPAQIDAALSGS